MPRVSLPPVEHHLYMQRCLELTRLGLGSVAPNPMVGCVIVHEGRIIGEGYHQRYGEAHAEVNAVQSVEDCTLLRKSTLYVSLEPCAHFGKTPPCADLIVKCGIPEVYVACTDPFSEVNGKGIARLREAGVNVHVGLLEEEAREMNRRFFLFHERKRPYIILKWAETRDGFVDVFRTGTEKPLSITCDAANVLSHQWRGEEAAIMVGKGTALLDDPSLTVRHAGGTNPTRIVLDSELTLPSTLKLFNTDSETLIVNALKEGQEGNLRWLRVSDTTDLKEVMGALHSAGIQSIMVEGGPTLHQNLMAAGLWDEVRRYVSPDSIGEGVGAARIHQNPDSAEMIGVDTLFRYRNRQPA